MTEKKLYTCDICRTDYANKEDAEKCEKEHTITTKINNFCYLAHGNYPTKIEVEFSNGKRIWYRL